MERDPYRIIQKRNKKKIIFRFVIWMIAFCSFLLIVWQNTWVMVPIIIIAFFWPITYLFWALHFRTIYKKLVLQGKEEVFIKEEIIKERVRLGNYVSAIFIIILGLFISILFYGVIDWSAGRFMFILGLLYVVLAVLALIFRKAVYNFSIKFERNEAASMLLRSASFLLLAFPPVLIAIGFALEIYIISISLSVIATAVAIIEFIVAWKIVKRTQPQVK